MHTRTTIWSPSAEHEMLRSMVRDFAKTELEPGAQERDQREYFDVRLFRKLGGLGLLGITVAEEHGGSAMDAVACVIAHEELAYADPGFTLAYLAHAMLAANNIARNASPEQKRRYLPKLCRGEWVGAMAMSEPDSGTDVLGMRTLAQKHADGYVINGRKMWITNGVIDNDQMPADVLFLYAKTRSDEKSVTSFIIEGENLGYRVGQKLHNKLGMRASSTAEMVFDNCHVRPEQRVGLEGDALHHMMKNLEIERITLAAISLGIARRALTVMNQYAAQRTAFGHALNYFGQIQKHIADSYAKYMAARTYVYHTALHCDLEAGRGRIDSDGVKLFAATAAKEIADAAIQVLGGNGYMGEYVVERLWRDAKLMEIGGGTVEAHQKNITKELAKNHCHAMP